VRALRVLGVSPEKEGQIFAVLAGLLHLGNLTFLASKDDVSEIRNKDVLDVASELLGLDRSVFVLFRMCPVVLFECCNACGVYRFEMAFFSQGLTFFLRIA
jgi:hypothetical protein